MKGLPDCQKRLMMPNTFDSRVGCGRMSNGSENPPAPVGTDKERVIPGPLTTSA